jgi:hypothetical protein
MNSFTKQKYEDFRVKDKKKFEDLEFVKCDFVHCLLGQQGVKKRCAVQNVRLLNCSQDRCTLYAPILRNVLVDGLNTKGQAPTINGAVFDQVTLRGKIDDLWIKPWVGNNPTEKETFHKANTELYKSVEWALDISQLDCKEIDLKGVPAGLVRRDPETQGIVTRANVLQGKWKKLRFKDGLFPVILEEAEESEEYEYPGVVLIAPKRAREFKDLVADLKMLRKAGVAEPN